MHIKFFQKNGPRHRHFVVVPVFLLLAISTFLLGGEAQERKAIWLPFSGTIGGMTDKPLLLSTGVRGIVAAGGSVDVQNDQVRLQEGSVFLTSRGIIDVQAGAGARTGRVRGLLGSIDVTLRNGILTVAALTTPALVQWEGERVVIPAGFQWRSSNVLTSPADGWMSWMESHGVSPIPSSFIQSKMTQEQTLLSTQPLPFRASLPAELSQGMKDPTLFLGVLPSLFADAHLWLLSSLHPILRTSTWALPPRMDVSNEVLALRLFSFPLADMLPKAASPVLVQKWQGALEEFIAAQRNPVPFIESLMTSLNPVLIRMAERGFPERMHRYAAVLISLAERYESSLSNDAKKILDELHTMDALSLQGSVTEMAVIPVAAPVAQSSSSFSSLSADAAKQLEQNAYLILRDAGALFTIKTEIHAIDASSVQVDGIVFSGRGGDRTFAFILDVQKHSLSNIHAGKDSMPYPMTVEEFVTWTGGR